MNLIDTLWLIIPEDNCLWKIHFLSDGKFVYTDPVIVGWEYWEENPWCDNGYWSMEGNSILFSFHDSQLVYSGFVRENSMAGTSVFISSLQTEEILWHAVRDN